MTLPRRTERLAAKALEAVLERYVAREGAVSTEDCLTAVQLVAALTQGEEIEVGEDGKIGFVSDHQGGHHDPYARPSADEYEDE